MDALQVLNEYSNLPFSFENQYLSISVRTLLPSQANASVTEINDNESGGKKNTTWFHLIAQHKSPYSAVAETGEVIDSDNATVKTFKVKFDKRSTEGVTASRFKDFFNTYYVGKKFFTFPVLSESQTTEKKGDKSFPVKNSIDVMVHPDFKLIDHIREVEVEAKKNQK